MLTLEVTPIEQLRDPAKWRAIYRHQEEIFMDHVQSHVSRRIDLVLSKMGDVLGVQRHQMAAFERHGGLNELDRLGDFPAEARRRVRAFDALDLSAVSDVSREQMVALVLDARASGADLSTSEELELEALEKGYDTSTMSADSWQEHEAASAASATASDTSNRRSTIDVADGNVRAEDLSGMTSEELARALLPTRANASLTPRQHTRRLMLRARRYFVAPKIEETDYKIVVEIRNRLLPRVSGKELNELRALNRQLTVLRLDRSVLRWDWTKTSDRTRNTLHDYFIAGLSPWKLAYRSWLVRMKKTEFIGASIMVRLGVTFHWGLGSQASFTGNGILRIISAIAKRRAVAPNCSPSTGLLTADAQAFDATRFIAQQLFFVPNLLTGILGVFSIENARIRRKNNPKENPGKSVPTLTQMGRQELLRVCFTAVYHQIKERLVLGPWVSGRAHAKEVEMKRQLDDHRRATERLRTPRLSLGPAFGGNVTSHVSPFARDAEEALDARLHGTPIARPGRAVHASRANPRFS